MNNFKVFFLFENKKIRIFKNGRNMEKNGVVLYKRQEDITKYVLAYWFWALFKFFFFFSFKKVKNKFVWHETKSWGTESPLNSLHYSNGQVDSFVKNPTYLDVCFCQNYRYGLCDDYRTHYTLVKICQTDLLIIAPHWGVQLFT